MKTFLFLLLIPGTVQAFTDESHFSITFGETRHFRIFTPPDYDPGDTHRKYPVIYFLHGCGGSYRKSGTYSYPEYGLPAPGAIGRPVHPDYEYPNNADFENFTLYNKVIIVCADGKIEGLPGCGVYFPSMAENWTGNFYNFSVYIKELIGVVDSMYNTLPSPQFRAISGLSMGGHAAMWLAAANPHLFSSASQFCHAPNFYDVGEPEYATTIDVQQLWRNLRGLPFRNTTTDRDYIQYYTMETSDIFTGAGFENEFYLAEYCVHMAARVDLQFAFHMKHFGQAMQEPACFSHMNLYPSFGIRGYEISSLKSGNGWIYLHDVTRNGLGIYTRRRFPWGGSLHAFSIRVSTPAVYIPDHKYTVSRYCYHKDVFRQEQTTADKDGRISLETSGGMGEEIGILGPGLQPPVIVLTDTLNENLYLDDDLITPLSFDIINLSDSPRNVEFMASSGNGGSLEIIRGSKRVVIPAFGKLRIDSMFLVKAVFTETGNRLAYLRIGSAIDGVIQEREQFIQVIIRNHRQYLARGRIKIFDGRSGELKVFKYDWGGWDDPLSFSLITEGSGNGNGIAECGEVFSIWIRPSAAFDTADRDTWHPVVAVNRSPNTDIQVEEVRQHSFSTGRALISAQIRLNRTPTADNPVRIPIQAEFLKLQPLTNDCHRKYADNFDYAFYEVVLGPKGIMDH